MNAPAGSPEEWEAIIVRFIKDHVERAKAQGVVLGLSGGLDSAVVAILAARALGPENVLGILMPATNSDPLDAQHGKLAAAAAGIEVIEHPIGNLVDGFASTIGGVDEKIVANATARIRMTVLYAEAQKSSRLVCGTGNKSELLVGYFSKHGDGGNDMQPIGDLYKTQVKELALQIGVPKPIIEKPPSAGLWPGQTDEAELGVSYQILDSILKGMELNRPLAEISTHTGIEMEVIMQVEQMVRRSEHKRQLSLIPKLGTRTVGIDWRRPIHWDG